MSFAKFWDLDEADPMSKKFPRKRVQGNQYVHPNPRRMFTIMSAEDAANRPKEECAELEITGDVRNLSSKIWTMTNLTSLYLNNNALTFIPGEISLLVNLNHLNASFNKLRNIPPEIGDMSSLRELILNHNRISSLPVQLGQLFKLSKLELTGNPLGSHILDIINRPSYCAEDILTYLIDHVPFGQVLSCTMGSGAIYWQLICEKYSWSIADDLMRRIRKLSEFIPDLTRSRIQC
ncbi:hypothetical protein JTE90_008981 [Oedothorax gibbosus]|uniref:Uncharacterized protein n=1 Tax=Oedothorax gibbosus TaxID=931172 RepID=A0AAV6UJB4_9ARAC|nr:hypothetical protein JTE90_008981 [Oedothorax gibbosus]